jgi:superfamily II DNA or RNA helicase/HKD family nuclease
MFSHFQQSLIKGYLSENTDAGVEFLPEFLTNDPSQYRKILTTILHELKSCDEFCISVAFITTSGVAALMNTLLELKDREIKGKIVGSKYLNFTQPMALKRLLENFPNIELRVAEYGDFHAKGYLFRKDSKYNMIIGSSNLTSAALSKNKEWNLKISALKESSIMSRALEEFRSEFEQATKVTHDWIESYSAVFEKEKHFRRRIREFEDVRRDVEPNMMQQEALANLLRLRSNGAKKAILISATGTGKTFLAAFDVAAFAAKRCLFVVHRRTIAEAALRTFKEVIGKNRTYGLYSGNSKDLHADFIFSTVQTISMSEHIDLFKSDDFDYIIIDETHRAGADSYKRILDYFKPSFLLGMTATPERTDGLDIFSLFEHNVAYEIRLHRALAEGMLSEFHYFGVRDITADGRVVDDRSDFRFLAAEERVRHILHAIRTYGTDDGIIRGLVFCSRKEEASLLSEAFNTHGYRTVFLSGESSEESRKAAIERLESNNQDRLDYIFTVDIFNEGIDIPRVNQILLLRPTNSAIVFVQQLGRGLRKVEGKQYVTVIDFIGNYQNNFLVPIALYGDTSYNKDTLRKLIGGGSRLIPGASTINFDKVTEAQIYSSIDGANMQVKRDLDRDYQLLKFRLGRIPMMMDFIDHGSRDPFHYISYSKHSYYAYVKSSEKSILDFNDEKHGVLLKYFSKEINNAKRVEESILLKILIEKGSFDFEEFKRNLEALFDYPVEMDTYESAINNLKLNFITENYQGNVISVAEIHELEVLKKTGLKVYPSDVLKEALDNNVFSDYLIDSVNYSIKRFSINYKKENFVNGFLRYRKYSRKDCFRILNWDQLPVAQSVGGYMFHKDGKNCPIFVNYHKADNISDTTKYDDGFEDVSTIAYMSKNKRNLTSPDVVKFANSELQNIRLPLFVKKDNGEGDDFYYMGDVTPISSRFQETEISNVSVVKMFFRLDKPVEQSLYDYITLGNG